MIASNASNAVKGGKGNGRRKKAEKCRGERENMFL